MRDLNLEPPGGHLGTEKVCCSMHLYSALQDLESLRNRGRAIIEASAVEGSKEVHFGMFVAAEEMPSRYRWNEKV